MTSEFLRGREHVELGAVGVVAEGRCAIALCRGGAAKTYSHTDPNEDAVAFAEGPGGALLVVADGHHGATGAETAVEHLLATVAGPWTGSPGPDLDEAGWRDAVLEALASANDAIVERALAQNVPTSPTTLSLALVRFEERLLVHGSAGDSHVFPVGAAGARDVAWASLGAGRTYFLGYPRRSPELESRKYHADCEPLDGLTAVVVASDGLSESGIGVADPAAVVGRAVAEAREATPPATRALHACKAVARAAIDAHRRNAAGDNIASGVIWL